MNSYELGKLLACKQTEVGELRMQLASRAAEIAELRETLCSVSTSLPAWQQKKVMDVLTNTKQKG